MHTEPTRARSCRSAVPAGLALALCWTPLALPAQQELPGVMAAKATVDRQRLGGAGDFRLSLHESDGGLWAAGPDYKVGFADGMEFHPVLGPDAPTSQPLRWRTETIGSRSVGAPPRMRRAGDWRVEFLHDAGIVEAYDVLPGGVEQTFVLPRRPLLTGDAFDVVGRVETPLTADVRKFAHGELVFSDPGSGRTVLRYGAAEVFDAAGRRAALETGYVDGRITIRVPSRWLEGAVYPVTIDPLTSRAPLTGAGAAVVSTEVVRDDFNDRVLVGWVRAVSASDHDVAVQVHDSSMTPLGTLYQNVSPFVSNDQFTATWLSNGSYWVYAIPSRSLIGGPGSSVQVYVHPTSSVDGTGRQVLTVPRANTSIFHSRPVVTLQGGSGFRASVVFEEDDGAPDSAATRICMARIESSPVVQMTATLTLRGAPNIDAQRPTVLGSATRDVVVWQERNALIGNDDWDLVAAVVDGTHNISPLTTVGLPSSSALHKIAPKLSGSVFGSMRLLYLTAENAGSPVDDRGSVLRMGELVLPFNGSLTVADTWVVDSDPAGNFLTLETGTRPLASDRKSRSHFVAVYRSLGRLIPSAPSEIRARRYGYEPGVVLESAVLESSSLFSPFGAASVVFDDDTDRFRIVYGGATANGDNRVYHREFVQPDAVASPYGPTSCGGGEMTVDHRPFAGTERYVLRVSNAPSLSPVTMLLAFGSANLNLPAVSPCPILIDPNLPVLTAGQEVTSGFGSATFTFPIPAALAGADLFWQAATVEQGTLFLSGGLETRIR